jgi:uncharacterized protein (TIGR00369 family)
MTQTQPEIPVAVEGLRERTYRWQDPSPIFASLGTASGIDLLKTMEAGELPPPPIMHTLGLSAFSAEVGTASFVLVPQEFHYNPLGSVHGGYGATLLDSAMGCAVHSVLDPGDLYTTLEFKINFLRAMTHETGEVKGTGTIVHAGRTTAIAEGKIEDASGKLYAFATTTCQIKRAGS